VAAKAVHHAVFTRDSLTVVIAPTLRQSAELLKIMRRFLRKCGHAPATDPANRFSTVLSNRDAFAGAPFLDFLRANGVRRNLFPISITSGKSITVNRGTHNIPKRDLMTNLQLMLQNRELLISSHLPHAPLLRDELANMRRRVDSFEPDRTSQHDDLLMALALAAWNCRK
jgi:hypothetical protein